MSARQPFEDAGREFDLVIFGATGFAGSLAATYMCSQYLTKEGQFKGSRFALSGRSMQRLQQLKDRLQEELKKSLQAVPLLIADIHNDEDLHKICGRTKVVVSTAGPFVKIGEPLVAACVAKYTHYCDLTGETPFMAEMCRKYGEQAAERGLKIVHACGIACVGSDLSCLVLQEKALQIAKRPCENVKAAVLRWRGGVSGGTVASLIGALDAKDCMEPFYLCEHALPKNANWRSPKSPQKIDKSIASFDQDFGYTGYNVEGPLDGCVVRWTNALLNGKYGQKFTYSMKFALKRGSYIGTAAISTMTFLLLFILNYKWLRSALFAMRILPRPGEGPSKEARDSGCFTIQTIGRVPLDSLGGNKKTLRVTVSFASDEGDPGYKESAKIVCEAAMCMAQQIYECSPICGVVSPAAGIGLVLKDRLQEKGITTAVEAAEEDGETSG